MRGYKSYKKETVHKKLADPYRNTKSSSLLV